MGYEYHLSTLANGVRIASVEMPHMQSVSVGIWAGIGGRYESRKLSGISHFIEHLMFKGTRQRNSKQIIEAVEGIGGYLNAFTTEDHTCYYAKAGASHLGRLCDVLGDMYVNSEFSETDIEREREVIREEILMYRDNPAQHAQELLSETMWPSHPLGRALTGTEETISSFTRDQMLAFMREHYNGRTTIVTVAGKVSHDRVLQELGPRLGKLPRNRAPRFARWRDLDRPPRVTLVTQDTEQTHLAMGFYALGRADDRRFALKLLSVILGENMSSRLFQKLRERHGFCYSVSSGMVALADAGLIHICAGLDPAKLRPALRVIIQELERLADRKPSRKELQRAQDYTVGQTFMGLESTTNQMMWMGESVLGYNRVLDPAEIEARILQVAPEDIQGIARFCLNRARLGLAIVGPQKDAKQIEGWLR